MYLGVEFEGAFGFYAKAFHWLSLQRPHVYDLPAIEGFKLVYERQVIIGCSKNP